MGIDKLNLIKPQFEDRTAYNLKLYASPFTLTVKIVQLCHQDAALCLFVCLDFVFFNSIFFLKPKCTCHCGNAGLEQQTIAGNWITDAVTIPKTCSNTTLCGVPSEFEEKRNLACSPHQHAVWKRLFSDR